VSTTPPDFPLVHDPTEPPPAPRDDTGSFVRSSEFRPVARIVEKLWSTERERRGELRVLTWLVGIALPLGVAFFAWMTLRIEDMRGDVRELAAEVHTAATHNHDNRPAQDADR
jgi:hypothetical protein